MKPKRIIALTAVVTVLSVILTPPTALAANVKSVGDTVAASDKNFMVTAAEGGMLEVRLGEIAKKKGATQQVRDFGAMMVTDHGKAGDNLKVIAAKHGVTLPAELNAENQAVVNRLRRLSGDAFDKAYITEMVKAHSKDASAFEVASKKAKDRDLKAFAQQMLPVIKMHLQHIKGMANSGGGKKR
jgi:putative membrane protein